MTPTGLVLCVLFGSAAVFLPQRNVLPVPGLAFLGCFLAIERRPNALKSIWRGLVVVLPIAIYLSLVWILIVGAAPMDHVLSRPAAGQSAVGYVANLSLRLFLFVVLVHAALTPPLAEGALPFVAEMKLPKALKMILAMTLSIASTIRASAAKAWVSLVAANLLTPRLAWRNARHSILLAQAIWMFIVGTVTERLQTKWMVENLEGRLSEHFASHQEKPLTWRDVAWLGGSISMTVLAVALWLR